MDKYEENPDEVINEIIKQKHVKVETRTKEGEKEYFNDVNRLIIEVDGVEFRIHYNKVYGLIINKVSISDDKEDTLIMQPRTGNEIILK